MTLNENGFEKIEETDETKKLYTYQNLNLDIYKTVCFYPDYEITPGKHNPEKLYATTWMILPKVVEDKICYYEIWVTVELNQGEPKSNVFVSQEIKKLLIEKFIRLSEKSLDELAFLDICKLNNTPDYFCTSMYKDICYLGHFKSLTIY
jgi:hypothetical protein